MGAQIKPTPELDDAKLTVTYQLQVQEGDLYHMGDFDVHGLDTPTSKRLALAWKLAEGDVYDASYPAAYLKSLRPTIINLSQWKIKTLENVDSREDGGRSFPIPAASVELKQRHPPRTTRGHTKRFLRELACFFVVDALPSVARALQKL